MKHGLMALAWLSVGWGLVAPNMVLAESRESTLVIIDISDDPKKDIGNLKPMVDYVASKMGDVGITKGEVVMVKSLKEVEEAVKAGKVDWFTSSPFAALILVEKGITELTARKWKSGVAEYYSLVIVKKESTIKSIEQLKGNKIAFADERSTSSFFLPSYLIKTAGLSLSRLAGPRDAVPADKVGYVFSKEDINTATWIQKGVVVAGGLSNLDLVNLPENLRNDLQVLVQTKPVPRALESVRIGLDAKVKAKFKEVLLAADQDPAAKDALKAYHKTAKFDDIAAAQAGIEESKKILLEIRELF